MFWKSWFIRPKGKHLGGAFVLAAALTTLFQFPPLSHLGGLSLDVSFWLSEKITSPVKRTEDSPVAVIVIDELTARTPPFDGMLMDFWREPIADVIDALASYDNSVIGLDLVFQQSTEGYLKGSEERLLEVVGEQAQRGKIVLAASQSSGNEVAPHEWLSWVAGQGKNIRSINVRETAGVIRELPLSFRYTDGTWLPSFGLELAARYLGSETMVRKSGAVGLNGRTISPDQIINFQGTGETFPTYSLAAVWHCLESGKRELLASHFENKVVLIGVDFGLLDHKLTSWRMVGQKPYQTQSLPCFQQEVDINVIQERPTIPGVFIQAAITSNIIQDRYIRDLDPLRSAAYILLAIILISAPALLLRSARAPVFALAIGLLFSLLSFAAFTQLQVLPLLRPLAGGLLAFSILFGIRLTILDRSNRLVLKAFGSVLPKEEIKRLVDEGVPLKLGGETRVVTVWISDLENYSSYSEIMAPDDLVRLLNKIYGAMGSVVAEHGGFVMQYVGDALVAVFGAPRSDPEHAAKALRAAQDCCEVVENLNRQVSMPDGHRLRIRIGVGTGELLLGHIGSEQRMSYTALGDRINLAARLEGANKVYGTQILCDAPTAAMAAPEIDFRCIDQVRVKGRSALTRFFEPLLAKSALNDESLSAYKEALALFQSGKFEEAASLFEGLAAQDPVSQFYLDRCQEALGDPPVKKSN